MICKDHNLLFYKRLSVFNLPITLDKIHSCYWNIENKAVLLQRKNKKAR